MLKYIALYLACFSISSAAIIQVRSSTDNNEIAAVVNTSGALIPAGSGVVLVGTFNGVTDAQISGLSLDTKSTVLAGFQQFGTTTTRFGGELLGNTPGAYNNSYSVTLASLPSGSSGKNIYTIIGNGTTATDSTEFLVVKSTVTVPVVADDSATLTLDPNLFGSPSSAVLFGRSGLPASDLPVIGITGAPTYGLAAVPEPTVAGLGVLALALVRRRRR
jgi:hypothetical protein